MMTNQITTTFKTTTIMSKYTTQTPVATKKIVLDFTNVETDQETAIMPAWLAKQLLIGLALEPASARSIVGSHIDSLREVMGQEEAIQKAVELSIHFVQMRQLIKNVQSQNWDAYIIPDAPAEVYAEEA
jgi:hypothetical protein